MTNKELTSTDAGQAGRSTPDDHNASLDRHATMTMANAAKAHLAAAVLLKQRFSWASQQTLHLGVANATADWVARLAVDHCSLLGWRDDCCEEIVTKNE